MRSAGITFYAQLPRVLYGRLKEARVRQKDAADEPESVQADLKLEVQLLQRQCGVALDEMQAEFARVKDAGASR